MTYYEELLLARKNNIDALDLYCSTSAEWFLKDFCNIKEDNKLYIDYFNNLSDSIKSTYLHFDNLSFQDIEGYLMDLKEDEKSLSIDEIAEHLEDFISGEWSPENQKESDEMEM